MTFRLGILGSGNISDTHARAARGLEGVRVVANWGRDLAKVRAMADCHDTRPFDDLDAFLGAGLDGVVIGTPSGMHGAHATAAAARGLHVLVEKPLEVTTAQCDAQIAACDRAGVVLGVIFQDRTAPDLAWVKRTLAAGALGTPLLVSARVKWYRPPAYYAASGWRGTWALDGGGALMNQGIHTVDLLLWLFGDVARVSARTRTLLHSIDVEDTAVSCLEFATGAVGTLEATTAAYPGFARRIELTGTEGTIAIEGDRVVGVDLRSDPPEPPPRGEGSTSPSASSPVVSDVRGHARVIEDFVAAAREGRPPLCDGRQGRRSVALVEAVYRAANAGWVVVGER